MRKAYLDIETNYTGHFEDGDHRLIRDYKNHKITVIGIRIIDAEEDTFVQLVDKQVTKKRLLETLKGVDCIVTYNGRSIPDKFKGYIGFDFPVIAAQLGVVLDKMYRHIDIVPVCWKHNLYGGQKKVEQILGLKRKLPDKDGAWANITWRKYEKTKKKRYLDELLAYNKEDVFMLRRIEKALK